MVGVSSGVRVKIEQPSPSRSLLFASEEGPLAESSNISVWNNLLDLFKSDAKPRKTHKSSKNAKRKLHISNDTGGNSADSVVEARTAKKGLKRERNSRGRAEEGPSDNAIKAKISLDSCSTNVGEYICPICSHTVVGKSSQNVLDEAALLKHMRCHEGELDSSSKFPCTLCFNYYKTSAIDKHYKQAHDSSEGHGICEVFLFTNSVQKYRPLSDLPPSLEVDSATNVRPISPAIEGTMFYEDPSPLPTDQVSTELLWASVDEESATDVAAQSSESREINENPMSLIESTIEKYACERAPNVEQPDDQVLDIESSTVSICSDSPCVEDKITVIDNPSSLQLTSVSDHTPTVFDTNVIDSELECHEERSGSNLSSAELHKLAVRQKFSWDGPPPPPLDVDQVGQLMKLFRNECPFCKDGPRILRIPENFSDETKEESMIAHIVKFHNSDPAATWVFDHKRYNISVDEKINPLKFLLKPAEDGSLICSSCEKATFPKLSNLRIHWPTCISVCGRFRDGLRKGRCVLVSASAATTKEKKCRSKNQAVECPLPNCNFAWRPSFIYNNAVGQIAHMICRHGSDEEAYELAMKIGKEERLSEEFPFLDVANVRNATGVFSTINELVQHARRYHPTEENYSGAPKCPISSCTKTLRRWYDVSDNVLQLLHVMKEHVLKEEGVLWISRWTEKFDLVMEEESKFKFDVLKSLRISLEKGSAHLSCLQCRKFFEYSKYLHHRKRGLCIGASEMSESTCNSDLVSLSGREACDFDESESGRETSKASQIPSVSEVSQKSPRSNDLTLSNECVEETSMFLDASKSSTALRDEYSLHCNSECVDTMESNRVLMNSDSSIPCAIACEDPLPCVPHSDQLVVPPQEPSVSSSKSSESVNVTDGTSKSRSLFDELPERIFINTTKPVKPKPREPPEDISHLKEVEGYPCNYCNFKALKISGMRRHIYLSHSDVLPSMAAQISSPCHHCAKVLETRRELLRHITYCHADIPNAFKCGSCHKSFGSAHRMREHERRTHESKLILDPKHLQCPICNREFDDKRSRDDHVKRHAYLNSDTVRGSEECVSDGIS
ncbi:hypothetical protein KIN20_036759 [Parelaphostrongylus tenuis]|uniref:C2H2-type domain-containing protein n=1 Tax=Parelaphostrongylus tenuis TaxID=148309 RepID=A0AAD5WLX1_PARTN|nr:hypothetical protein KIN20_036759 [Parelaphostrongylus tenuis]